VPRTGDEIPANIGKPATSALRAAGYERLSQLTSASTRDLLKLHVFGPKALRLLRDALAETGKTFADERPR
jgi:DNA-directed RNA polymerase alpha subunit